MINSNIYIRLRSFIEHTQLSNNKFAEKANLSGAQLSYMVNSEKKFGIDKLINIFNAFPDLNPNWLLKGEGEMLFSLTPTTVLEPPADQSLQMPKVVTVDNSGKNNIIQIDAQAAAGFPANYDNPKYYEDLPAFSLPSSQFQNGTFICLQAVGDSMHPTIYHHDWLIAEFLPNPSESIQEGYVHIVVTTDGVVVKRILNQIGSRNKIVLQSDNEQYPIYEEDISNVLQIYKVTAKLSYILRNESTEIKRDLNSIRAEIASMKTKLG